MIDKGNFDGLELTSNYILIRDGGEMWVGSEDCKFTKNATISLTGSQGTLSFLSFLPRSIFCNLYY